MRRESVILLLRAWIMLWAIALVTVLVTASACEATEATARDRVVEASRYTVLLTIRDRVSRMPTGSATGVVIGPRTLLTAGHVCDKISASLVLSTSTIGDLNPTAFDPAHDVCLLETNVPQVHYAHIPIALPASSLPLEVVIVGHPLGDPTPIPTLGFAMAYAPSPADGHVRLHLAAPAVGGNSGGAVVDLTTGDLVGILIESMPKYHHLSWATSVDDLNRFLDSQRPGWRGEAGL